MCNWCGLVALLQVVLLCLNILSPCFCHMPCASPRPLHCQSDICGSVHHCCCMQPSGQWPCYLDYTNCSTMSPTKQLNTIKGINHRGRSGLDGLNQPLLGRLDSGGCYVTRSLLITSHTYPGDSQLLLSGGGHTSVVPGQGLIWWEWYGDSLLQPWSQCIHIQRTFYRCVLHACIQLKTSMCICTKSKDHYDK